MICRNICICFSVDIKNGTLFANRSYKYPFLRNSLKGTPVLTLKEVHILRICVGFIRNINYAVESLLSGIPETLRRKS